jgi:tyrosine-protein kinase Etk/Wzc
MTMNDSENLPANIGPRNLAPRTSYGAMLDPSVTQLDTTEGNGESLSLPQLILTVKRHRLLISSIALTVLGLAALYNWKAERVYTSTASVRIDDKESSGSLLKGVVPLPNFGSGKVLTEMEVLRSRHLSENVASGLHLNFDVTKPAAGRKFLQLVSIPDSLAPAAFKLKRTGPNTYALTQDDGTKNYAAPSSVQTSVPFSIGDTKIVLQPANGAPPPDEISFRFRSLRDATDAIRQNLAITRPNREAEIVNISYQSNDPELTAAVPNLLLDEFIKYKAQSSRTKASSTVNFLRGQVASYDTQLKQAESALGDFREKKQVVSLSDEAAASVKRMAELQAERDRLVSEQTSIRSILAKPAAPGESNARDIAAFPSFIANRGMQDILASLLTLETERNALLVRRNPANADVAALTTRISDLNAQLLQMARGYLSGIDSKIAALDTNIGAFGKQVETIPATEIQYARLARDEKLLEEISTLLNTRLKESEIEEAVEPGDAQLIDRALVPDKPTSPRVVLNLLLGLFGGLGLGFLAGVGRDMLDTKVRTKEQTQAATGGIPVLAAIPRFVPASGMKPAKRNGDLAIAKGIAPGSGLITVTDSRSPSAEAYRSLRTSIAFADADVQRKVMVFTSALAGDGKSTTASNLALTLAQQGVRTLLVDADLRKGVLHKLFSVRREPGFTQVLVGETKLEDAIQIIAPGESGVGLSILTAGPYPPNPAELLGSARMRTILAEMRERYDTIVFDTPPLGMVTDAAILGTLADTTILVTRAGVTEKKALQHAASQLYHLRVHVSGTILNDFDPRQAGYGYEYGYGYGYAYGAGKS